MMSTTGVRPRLALVGCGPQMIGMLVPALQFQEIDLVAVCDIDRGRAEALSARYRIPATFTDLGELLEVAQVDGVCIATGAESHPRLIEQAVHAGVAVFVEKPPAPSAAAAYELLARIEGAPRPVMVGLNKRYALAYRALLQLGKQQRSGRPIALTLRCSCGSDRQGLAALLDVGIHAVDLIQYLLGPITSVYASADRHDGTARCYAATLHANGGSLAQFFFSACDSWENPSEHLFVQWRQTAAEVINLRELQHRRNAASLLHGWNAEVDTGATRVWSANTSYPSPGTSSLALQGYLGAMAAFARAISFPPAASPSLQDAARALAVLEAIERSAGTGTPVTVTEP